MSKSKPMKKGVKIALIILIVAVLLATCFLCVGIYAKNEFNKEKSWLPPKLPAQKASVTELPQDIHGAYEYVTRLYADVVGADNVETSWHTDVDLGGEMTLPFGEVDNSLISMIRDGASGGVRDLYPHESGVKKSDEKAKEIPAVSLKESDIIEYPYDAENIFNRKGEYSSDVYEIVLKLDPSFENADEIRHSSVYEGICDALKPAVTVNSVDLDTHDVEMIFRVDRLTDHLQSVDIARSYEITANVTLTDEYASLSANGSRDAVVKLPYRAIEKISFKWYGLRFTVDYLEQEPDDIVPLPYDVNVNDAAVRGEDFKIEYEISDPDTMEIDDDGVMTINRTDETSATEGVRLTATLVYEGKTYSDDLIVYITTLDKATAGVRFWEDSAVVTVGKETPLPAEIRVPINEAADQQKEEEYELSFEISDPDALKIEEFDKELYATGLKEAQGAVTVKVTMKCGGHTYYAELPVTILKETEATGNG